MILRIASLSTRELFDLAPALWRLIVIRLSLFSGIARTRQRFGGSPDTAMAGMDRPSHPEPLSTDHWPRRALALRRVSRFVPGAHCLARALALRWWMRRAGLDALIVIGVRRTTEGIASHAWVELDGQPVDESERTVERFQVISLDHVPAGRWTR